MMRDQTDTPYLWIGLSLSVLLHLGIASGFLLWQPGVPASSPSNQPLALQLSAFSVAATSDMKGVNHPKAEAKQPADLPIKKTLPAAEQTIKKPIAKQTAMPSPDSVKTVTATATRPLSKPQDISEEIAEDLAEVTSNDNEISQEPQIKETDDNIETLSETKAISSPSMASAQQSESVVSSTDTGVIVSLEAQYKSALRQAIEPYKYYPKQAWRMRREGTVIVGFMVDQGGDISNVHIIESSGTSAIDSAAINALQRMGRFRPIPMELSRQSWAMEIPLEYSIL